MQNILDIREVILRKDYILKYFGSYANYSKYLKAEKNCKGVIPKQYKANFFEIFSLFFSR